MASLRGNLVDARETIARKCHIEIGPPRLSFRCFMRRKTRSFEDVALSCHVERSRDISHYFWSGDLIRSLPVRATSGLPVRVAASQPLHSQLHYASVEMTTPS